VNVTIAQSQTGTITGATGEFMLVVPTQHLVLVFSHIGYQKREVSLHDIPDLGEHLQILMQPKSVSTDEVVITANRTNTGYDGINNDIRTRTVDDYLASTAGLDLVSRANMARDPMVRGLRDGRVAVMVDGMRLTPACVDGMDPATAYIETDNLKSIEVSKGFNPESPLGASSGAAVNFSLSRPVLDSGLTISAETGYQSVSKQKVVQGSVSYGQETWALRVSGTLRDATDYYAGNRKLIAGSGFRKSNILTSLVYHPEDQHQFNLRYIGDFAEKIGYPNLIMDTRKATAHIIGLEHAWRSPLSGVATITTNLYLNTVNHLMDDYDRDVTARSVMPNMYMPMDGETVTTGLTSKATVLRGNHTATVQLEAYQLYAFADMLMEHLDPAVRDMYLINLGEVTQQHLGLTTSYRYIASSGWQFGSSLNIRGERNILREPSARATYEAEYPGLNTLEPVGFAYTAGISLEKELHQWVRFGVQVSNGIRLADHMERYGYYIYQPLDGHFYFGNPGLRPEQSTKFEVTGQFGSSQTLISGNVSVWVNQLGNYISGFRQDALFKRYHNMGSATLTGFEMEMVANLHPDWKAGSVASYVNGTHQKLNEPLPMIPPLKGTLYLQRQSRTVQLEGRLRWAASQHRIASQNSLETTTDGHILIDFFAKKSLGDIFSLQIGIENVLDTYYIDHLSVNSVPSTGRNVQLSLRLKL
jgi:iron complex outermembrane receptor protein